MQNKHVLYISFVDYADPRDWGVSRKVDGQISAFKHFGYQVDQLKINDKAVYINDDLLLTLNGKVDYYLRMPLKLNAYFRSRSKQYDLIYIRKSFFTPLYFSWFRRLKAMSRCIVMEIPTYPYKVEITGRALPVLLDDMANLLLKPILYKIVTTQNFDRIAGLKTIRIRNGYDFSDMVPHERTKTPGTVTLITVANISFWHGLERVLHGIRAYYDDPSITVKEKIVFHIIGTGPALPELKELKEQLKLNDVHFYGPLKGKELQDVYSKSDIGMGSFGLYKKGTTFQSSLKNMEYCYQGIPFVLGNHDEDLENTTFMLECPNDPSPVDIKKIVDWYRALDTSTAEIQEKGRQLYSWEKQINIILQDIAENVGKTQRN